MRTRIGCRRKCSLLFSMMCRTGLYERHGACHCQIVLQAQTFPLLARAQWRRPDATSMPASGLPQWRQVSVQSQYVIAGGYGSNKIHPLETMEVETGKCTIQFCKVTKNELWLLKCAGGPQATKGMLKRSKILEELKEKLSEASKNPVNAAVAVRPEEAAVAVEDDPIQELDNIDDEPCVPPGKRPKYSRKRMLDRVFQFDMPNRPPGTAGTAVAESRTISVVAKGTNQLWISIDDLDWLIGYVAVELAFGGVPLIEESAVAEGNCVVPDLALKWDFGQQSWKAKFVAGPRCGEEFVSSVSKMTAQKWATITDAVAVDFDAASFEELKEGTRAFCSNIVRVWQAGRSDCGAGVSWLLIALPPNAIPTTSFTAVADRVYVWGGSMAPLLSNAPCNRGGQECAAFMENWMPLLCLRLYIYT